MAQSDDLERQAEQTRRQLSATLDELRGRLRPASVGREVLGVARRSAAGRFVNNLGIDAADNAVPLAGIAASIAWIMLSRGRRPGTAPSGSYARVRDAAGQLFEAAAAAGAGVARTAAAGASAVQDAARSASQTATSAAQRISETSSAAMASTLSARGDVQQRLSNAARTTRRSGQAMVDGVSTASRQAVLSAGAAYKLTRNDPVFAAGIGLALAGVAAAVFGWSRKPVDERAVGALTDAAKQERRREPTLSAVAQGATSIIPEAAPASTIYGEDRTGAAPAADDLAK